MEGETKRTADLLIAETTARISTEGSHLWKAIETIRANPDSLQVHLTYVPAKCPPRLEIMFEVTNKKKNEEADFTLRQINVEMQAMQEEGEWLQKLKDALQMTYATPTEQLTCAVAFVTDSEADWSAEQLLYYSALDHLQNPPCKAFKHTGQGIDPIFAATARVLHRVLDMGGPLIGLLCSESARTLYRAMDDFVHCWAYELAREKEPDTPEDTTDNDAELNEFSQV